MAIEAEQIYMNKIMDELGHLSCPFTWDMMSVTSYSGRILVRENERLSNWVENVNEDLKNIPLLKLVYSLMTAFEYTANDKLEEAIDQIKESEKIFLELESVRNSISIKAVDHVVKGTKCFILKKMNKYSDIKSIGNSIHPCCQDKAELGTLYGCRAMAWSLYFHAGFIEAMQYSRKAIAVDSKNGLWYFILGNSLRVARKYYVFDSKPSAEEQMAFHNAFMFLPNPHIGTYYANVEYESKNFVAAEKVYNNIVHMKPSDCEIYFKLTLGYIRLRNSVKAHDCLEYLEKKIPCNPKYLQYKGLYLEKCVKDYEGALIYFEKAGSLCRYNADSTYLELKNKITQGNYNPIEYLTNMLERYQFCSFKIQLTYLQLASYYKNKLRDVRNACKYYLKAIEVDPKRKLLLKFQDFYLNPKANIYDVLKTNIIPKLKADKDLDESTSEMLKAAEKAYEIYKTHNRVVEADENNDK